MSAPELTVVIPTYNQAALLERCLAALAAQDAPEGAFEVVVVDDGSSDGTADLLARRAAAGGALRVLTHPNVGPSRSRNRGIAAARGRFVAFTDSDCEPARDWISRLLAAFGAHPHASGIEGRIVTVEAAVTPFTHQVENLHGGLFCTANIAYRREVLDAVGGFDEDFFYGHEDTDLALRAEPHGPIVFEPAVLVVHPPVPTSFGKLVKRPTVWTCQIVLFVKHPRRYLLGYQRGPFRVLLRHYGVRQLVDRVWRFRAFAWREPGTFLAFLLAMFLQRVYLLACMPGYLRRYVELKRGGPRRSGASRLAHERRFHDDLYRNVPVDRLPRLDRFNAHAFGLLGSVEGLRVLDVGCGDGELSAWLALGGATVFALDLSEEALKLTARRAEAVGVRDRIHLLSGSFEDLPLAAASVDRVIGSLVLHHVDPGCAGREIARVLTPEGRGAFSENFGFNPFLNAARRHLVGRFGIPRLGTETEKPLDAGDVSQFGARLAVELAWPEFLFFQLLDRQVFRYRVGFVNRACRWLDEWVFEHLPSLRRYSYRGTLVVQRP